MKKLFILFLLQNIAILSFTQNLVSNGSFEDTTFCPNGIGTIETSAGWFSIFGSPDFFTDCGDFPMIPLNPWGYQMPKTGSSYAGIVTYGKDFPEGEEAFSKELSIPLIIGEQYFISFFTNLSLNNFESGYANNNIGALLSTLPFSQNQAKPINNFAHVKSQNIIEDSLNWTRISGWITADSSYKFISIGNFFNHSQTDTFGFDNTLWVSYYFIDDVCVSNDANYCDFTNNLNEYTNQQINVNPNPVIDKLNIQSKLFENKKISITITDFLGNIIFQSIENSSNIIIDCQLFSPSLYFLSIKIDEESTYNEIFIKQ